MPLSRRFSSVAAALLLLSVLLTGAGCVTNDDIEGLHRQMSEIETEIQALERKSSSKEEVAKLNANVATQTTQLLKSNADTGVKLNELTTKMEQLEAKLEDTNRRLSQLSQQIAETQGDLARMRGSAALPAPGSGGPVATPAPLGTGRSGFPTSGSAPPPASADTTIVRPSGNGAAGQGQPSPSQLYDTAYGDYGKGRYALAIQGFQEYIDAYPNTDLTDNAQYWIGESHYAQKKFKEAIADFDKVLKTWPKSDKASSALLKKGYALLELNQKAEAVVELQYVIHEYPAAEEARLARSRLKSLGIEIR
jgi:tol-pal system protein YbgF